MRPRRPLAARKQPQQSQMSDLESIGKVKMEILPTIISLKDDTIVTDCVKWFLQFITRCLVHTVVIERRSVNISLQEVGIVGSDTTDRTRGCQLAAGHVVII